MGIPDVKHICSDLSDGRFVKGLVYELWSPGFGSFGLNFAPGPTGSSSHNFQEPF